MANFLAGLNATLNGTSALCLLVGWLLIRRKQVSAHRAMMLAAFGCSTLFLISYLTRFYLTGVHHFPHAGLLRLVYLGILISHTSLAALVPFLVLRTLYLAVKGRFADHRKFARITWPIWMYVSMSGVVVYLMLYHLD